MCFLQVDVMKPHRLLDTMRKSTSSEDLDHLAIDQPLLGQEPSQSLTAPHGGVVKLHL